MSKEKPSMKSMGKLSKKQVTELVLKINKCMRLAKAITEIEYNYVTVLASSLLAMAGGEVIAKELEEVNECLRGHLRNINTQEEQQSCK